MRSRTRRLSWLLVPALLSVPAPAAGADEPAPKPALDAIGAESLLAHIKTLSSDAFEGRGPGTEGEAKTVEYLSGQFRKLGLRPGNPDGSYYQDVPLVGFQ